MDLDNVKEEVKEVAEHVVEETKEVKTDATDKVNKAVDSIKGNLTELNSTPDLTHEYDAQDISSNKIMAVLCYFSILWLVPFFTTKESKFVKFHLNQGLTLLILEAIVWIIRSVLYSISYGLGNVFNTITGIILLAVSIVGIYNAATGKAKQLPVVGGIQILK